MMLKFDDQVIAAVRNATQTYLRYHVISTTNPAIWRDPQVRQEMQALGASLGETRNRIEAGGLGVQSSLLTPVVLGVQIAAYARAGVAKPTLKSHATSYRSFLARINGPEQGSLSHLQDQARRRHDDQIMVLKSNVLMARAPIDNFLLSGNQRKAETTDPCVIFTTIAWQGLDARGGIVLNQNAEDLARGMGRAIARNAVIAREDTILQTRLVRYDDGPAGYGAPGAPFSVFARVGDYCYVQTVNSIPGVDAAFSAARSWRARDNAARATLVELLNYANDARATLAIAEIGKQVVTGTTWQIDVFLSIP
jgi:hypothetical protein